MPSLGTNSPAIAKGVAAAVDNLDESPTNISDDELGISAEEIDAQYRRAVEMLDDADWGIDPVDEVTQEESVSDSVSAEQADADAPDESVAPSPVAEDAEHQPPLFSPSQILEAALFVGGKPLTSKKLAGLLGGSFDSSSVQSLADQLNQTYAAENRPYEIRLGEGGYVLALREAFAGVRNRVFGVGPREVKLSQDALGILELIA